jgi:hypothetical protein
LALIELSPDRPLVAPVPLPPAYRYRAFGLALAAVLVLALAGAVPAQVLSWLPAGLVPLPPDADFQVAGGRLFTFEVSGGRRVTSAWTARPLRRIWQVSTADDTSDGPQQGGGSVSVAGDFVLLQAGQTSTVLDARTGAVRWSSPLPIVPLGGTIGMIETDRFQDGTEYDEQSGAPGALFFGSDGQPHTEPPLASDLTGVDLATGRRLWTASFPGSIDSGSIAPGKARGRAGAVVVAASDQLSLISVQDGKVLATRSLPPATDGATFSATMVGDLLLVGQAGVVSAYTMTDLDRRWQRAEPEDQRNFATCTGLLCERAGPVLAMLDPATGESRWRTDGQVDVLPAAGYDLQVETGGSKPVRAVDPASGALAVDLSAWQTFSATSSGTGPLVLTRPAPGRRTVFGILRPGSRTVQRLGVTGVQVTDCAADVSLVACRAPTGVQVFTYSA